MMKKEINYPNLTPLLQPKSIAIVGASNDINKPSGLPLYFALKHKYAGKIFPVNPGHETVQGLKSYPSISDIPEAVDAVLIVLPAKAVPDVLKQCAEKGCKSIVLPVSGFAESGEEGRRRQDEIDLILEESGIRLCGPNTNGLLNVYDKVSLGYSYAQEVAQPGGLAYVTQSGALLSASAPRLAKRGVGFSYFIASGNQADLDTFDYAKFVLEDPRTKVLALYLEGLKSPEKLLDVADYALENNKPIVLIKVGRSEVAAKAAMSHTGSLVGSDAVFDAVCKQKGMTRVHDFDGLIASVLAFLKCPLPKGNHVGVISTSGGAMSLLGDQAEGTKLVFPELSVETKKKAAELVPSYGEFMNPFDIGAAGAVATRDADLCKQTVEMFAEDENIDIIIAAMTPIDPRGTKNFATAVVEVAKNSKKPMILFCPMDQMRAGEEEIFANADIPMLADSADCIQAALAMARFAEMARLHNHSNQKTEYEPVADKDKFIDALKNSKKNLNEYESKRLLAAYGIPITKEELTSSLKEAIQAGEDIGYPVCLKGISSDILHKTEAGIIKLDIKDSAELEAAYKEVMQRMKDYNTAANVDGILVQEMALKGREVIVGMSQDSQFGPTLMFGLGGVFVEALKDISLRPVPLREWDAKEMIQEIQGAGMLDAFRGQPYADRGAIVDILLKLSRLAEDLGDLISEIDINPLMVFGENEGAVVVDALVILKE
jgi:acetyltransferase